LLKVIPDRIHTALARLAAAGWAMATTKFAIGAHGFRTALAANKAGPMRLCSKTFVVVAFKYNPSSKSSADRDQWVGAKFQVGRLKSGRSNHAAYFTTERLNKARLYG
jgi:hypothetical protein